MNRGAPLRRSKGLKRTGRLAPVSTKTAALRRAAAPVADAVKVRDGGRCVVASRPGLAALIGVPCGSPSAARADVEVHELVRRSQWRAGVLDPDNRVTLCQTHHDWVGANPERASHPDIDLSRSRKDTP